MFTYTNYIEKTNNNTKLTKYYSLKHKESSSALIVGGFLTSRLLTKAMCSYTLGRGDFGVATQIFLASSELSCVTHKNTSVSSEMGLKRP